MKEEVRGATNFAWHLTVFSHFVREEPAFRRCYNKWCCVLAASKRSNNPGERNSRILFKSGNGIVCTLEKNYPIMCFQDSLPWGAQPKAGRAVLQPAGQAGEKRSSESQRWRWKWRCNSMAIVKVFHCRTSLRCEIESCLIEQRIETTSWVNPHLLSLCASRASAWCFLLQLSVKRKHWRVLSSLKKKKILHANISGAFFRLLSDRKGDKSWFCLLSYCLLVRCTRLLLSCCLLWIQPEHLNFPSVPCKGSNPGSHSLVIIAVLVRSLVKSFTWLWTLCFMILHKSS